MEDMKERVVKLEILNENVRLRQLIERARDKIWATLPDKHTEYPRVWTDVVEVYVQRNPQGLDDELKVLVSGGCSSVYSTLSQGVHGKINGPEVFSAIRDVISQLPDDDKAVYTKLYQFATSP